MMWQKARILQTDFQSTLGKEIWVKGRPYLTATRGAESGTIYPPDYVLDCFVVDGDGQCFAVNRMFVELLPEFAEDVKLISWEEFLKGTEEK